MNLSVISRVSLSMIVSQDLPHSECCPSCSLQGTSVRLQCWRQNVVCALAAARLALILEREELVSAPGINWYQQTFLHNNTSFPKFADTFLEWWDYLQGSCLKKAEILYQYLIPLFFRHHSLFMAMYYDVFLECLFSNWIISVVPVDDNSPAL